MKFGSLFAGIGGFDLGLERAGHQCAWQVEIDRDCSAVLARHRPNVKRLSDVRECGSHNLDPVDIITFGSPCQDLSVTGKRRGLEGARSGLFYEAIRIIRELRPTYAIWENVPGALSSNEGRDFGAALDALAESGALDIGWAVLDSQWFGVAQRRRRVFVVADFRGQRVGQILSIPYGSPRDTAPSRESGAGITAVLTAGTAASSGVNRPGRRREDDVNLVYSLDLRNALRQTDKSEQNRQGLGVSCDGVSHTLTQEFVPGIAHTLRSEGADASEDGTGRGVPLVASAFNWQSGGDGRLGYGPVPTALQANQITACQQAIAVRRLTPTECERLQAFPDGWTDGLSDSARYRCLGNAVTTNVPEWLGRQIMVAEAG